MDTESTKFQDVYDEQSHFVYNLSCRLCRTPQEAEDLFQESFLKVHRFLPKFRGGSLRAWLRRIVVNTQISWHRCRFKAPVLALEEHDGWKESLTLDEDDPAELAERREERQSIRKALFKLSEDARRVLVLKEYESLSYEEIANVLEVPIGTVRSRLARAREAMRRILEDSNG